ncbi:MAG: ABC transporter permease [Candidatus Fimimonas sp.]
MNKTIKKVAITAAKVVAFVAVILLLWWVFATVSNNELVLPQPWSVVKITFGLLGNGATYANLAVTLARSLLAFALSALFALALSLFVGVCPAAKFFVDGVVTALRALPTVAVILIFMIVATSSYVPVLVAFLVVFPVLFGAFMREIYADEQLLDVCKVYEVSVSKKIRYVFLPQILRTFLTQCKDTLILCVKVVVAGEVLALPKLGLGREMYVAKVNLETAQVLALTLLIVAVCCVISGLFALAQRKVKW